MKQVPIIESNDILTDTAFYKWLQLRREEGLNDTNFIPTIKEYTNNVEAPFKGRKDGTAHRYVFDCFWDNTLKPKNIEDLVKGDDLTKLKDAMRYLIRNANPTFRGQSRNHKLIADYAKNFNIDHQKLVDFLIVKIQL